MQILGVPDHVDRTTLRPTIDWPLSARCRQELALRDETIAEARETLTVLSDRELRAKVPANLPMSFRRWAAAIRRPASPTPSR
jgi:hypothetical protein